MKASLYAKLPYSVEIVPDLTTDGEQIFVARHPELPGCMAQGQTPQDAVESLADAREEYLDSLLEDGIEPPTPAAAHIGAQSRVTWTLTAPMAAANDHARPAEPMRVITIGQLGANQSSIVGAPSYAALG